MQGEPMERASPMARNKNPQRLSSIYRHGLSRAKGFTNGHPLQHALLLLLSLTFYEWENEVRV